MGFDDNLDLAYFRLASTGSSQYIQYYDYDGDGSITSLDNVQVISRRYKRINVQDSTPPLVVYTAPVSGSSSSVNPIVGGRVTDDLSGVASLTGQIDSGPTFPVTFDSAGNFSFVTTLSVGVLMTVCIPSIFVLQTERAMSRCDLIPDIFVLSSLWPAFVYTVSPPVSPTLGDFNLDGQCNAGDIPAMLTALADLSSFASTNKLSKEALLAIGDINGDGEVTNADFQALLNLVANSGNGSSSTAVTPNASVANSSAVRNAIVSPSIVVTSSFTAAGNSLDMMTKSVQPLSPVIQPALRQRESLATTPNIEQLFRPTIYSREYVNVVGRSLYGRLRRSKTQFTKRFAYF